MRFRRAVVFFSLLVLHLVHTCHGAGERIIDYDQLRNAVFLESGVILLAGDRSFHKLEANLSIILEQSICDTSPCENTNNIFLATKKLDKLIVCGTYIMGHCEMRTAADFSKISTSLPALIPSTALITSGDHLLLSYNETNNVNFVYKITDIPLNAIASRRDIYTKLELNNQPKPLVYFKRALANKSNGSGNYFLIHEIVNDTETNKTTYISKLLIVCDSAPISVTIACFVDQKKHGLIQNADIFNAGPTYGLVFAGVFDSSTDPQAVSGSSVVCISQLDPRWDSCTANPPSSTLTASYQLPDSEGYITSIKGVTGQLSNIPIINIGTSRGRLIQLYSESTNLASLNMPLQQFAYTVVQDGAPVVAIQSYKNGAETYIVTGKKIAVYLSANCDIYKTCNETVRGKNPLCGWCFFEGRSTTKSGCTLGWISMREPCSSISVSTEAQLVGSSQTVQIATEDFPLDGIKTDDKFKCRIKETMTEAAYNSSTKNFTCTIGEIREHQTTNVELIGSREGKEFLLGEKEYLIYQCDQIKRCGQCTDKRIPCQWCSGGCRSSCNANQIEPCPVVTNKEVYVPNGLESNVTFDVTILAKYSVSCIVKDEPQAFTGTSNGNKVTCNLKITNTSVAKQVVGVLLKYGLAELDHEIDVTVYRCDLLASDCTRCGALNTPRYLCHWSAGKCNAGQGGAIPCPSPTITSFSPVNAPVSGTQTMITIHGTDFTNGVSAVRLAGVPCSNYTVNNSADSDFIKSVVNSITCQIGPAKQKLDDIVSITFQNAAAQSTNRFYYQVPNITSIFPNRGIMAGGTVVTFSGKDLALGNRNILIRYNNGANFRNCSAIDSLKIECLLPPGLMASMVMIGAYFDEMQYRFNLKFEIKENPEVHNISSGSSILSGGTKINITGTNLTNANDYAVTVSYNGKETQVNCDNATDTLLQCRFPPAPENVEQDLNVKLEQNEQVADTSGAECQCVETSVKLQLDGYEKTFRVYYYPDPLITNFTDVKTIDKEEKYITLTGSYLNLAASPEEFLVSIGESQCTELIVTRTSLKCRIPDNHDDGSQYVVVVNVGSNYKRTVGYLKYDVNNIGAIVKIVGAVLGVLIGISVLVGLAVYGKFYMMRRKRMLLEQKLQAMEMEISSIARQEFAEMTNGMSFVNRTLVDQGLPFHGYQQYAFNVMFSSDQVLLDQVIYQGQPGQVKQSARKGLDSLEKLILNKMFLVSLVSTMEKEKRFFFKERANLSGNLCAILMGKMGYLNEVLQDLLMSLVQAAMANKTHKSLFRRCETITENLLSNWLALTMYPHLKAHSGSPLYLLFMAMQLTIENGPIDAITGDAKYSLSEEKLLRRWQSSRTDDNDVQFDGQPMTLKVIIDNGDQVYDCKVLDCDTITQVKSKSLSQIYVNYPASQLGVDPTELRLEWCAGHTAPAILKDEDNTSIKRGCLVRLNTLAHYNVPDKANMALVDPKTLDQEDYMNIKLDFPGQTKDTTKLIRGASEDVENPDDSTKWHLVKPEEDETEQRERSAIDELYLNKLFTTKQSINEYLTTLFDHILDCELCPPPAKFICDYMDILANKFKIDENTLFAWKSHSYAARVWGRMIRQPNQLFDVHVPQYVEDSLDVIAQVLEDSLAPSAPKLSKDCPGQKQVFYSEVQRYREKAKGFQKGLQAKGEQSNVLTEFLGDLNKMQQQQQSFNKMAYLQKLYDQLSPYLDEIVDGLASNTDTKNLELDKKMREVIDMLK